MLFTHKADDIQNRLGGGDPKWIGLITAGASVGVFANLAAARCVAGIAPLAACVASIVMMYVLTKYVCPKVKGLSEWNLGICMIAAMIVGTIVSQSVR